MYYRLIKSLTQILLPNYRGRLTEGILYNPRNNTLLWTDIILAEVHRVFLDDDDLEKRHQHFKISEPGESIGNVALTREPDTVLICAKYGIAIGSFTTGETKYLLHYEHNETQKGRLRSNDGIIDPWGNLWIGVMTDFHITQKEGGPSSEGFLYRIDAKDLSVKTMIEGAQISNGIAFSEDKTKLYWTDSLTYTVWQFDYDHTTVSLSNKKPIREFKSLYEGSDPEPDGMALTNNGHFYHAVFGTGSAVDYDASGNVYRKFNLPAKRVSCVAVGGKDDNEIFFTTIFEHVDDFTKTVDAANKEGDLGGFIFRLKLDEKLHGQCPEEWGGQL